MTEHTQTAATITDTVLTLTHQVDGCEVDVAVHVNTIDAEPRVALVQIDGEGVPGSDLPEWADPLVEQTIFAADAVATLLRVGGGLA